MSDKRLVPTTGVAHDASRLIYIDASWPCFCTEILGAYVSEAVTVLVPQMSLSFFVTNAWSNDDVP